MSRRCRSMLDRLRCGAADDLGDRPQTNSSRHTAAQTLTYPGEETRISKQVLIKRFGDNVDGIMNKNWITVIDEIFYVVIEAQLATYVIEKKRLYKNVW